MPNQATRYTTYERAHNTVHIGEKVINKSINQESVVGSVVQANGTEEFEDGLQT